MKRREFIKRVGAVATPSFLWPLIARAQQPGKIPTIGFLGAATPAVAGQLVAAFVARLRELGWIEGRTVAIEYRWAEGHTERYSEIAAEFVKLKVDIIVTWGSAPVLAAKHATALVPIVFAAQMDPVGAGVVTSLARPGGNVTGLSIQTTDTAGKRLELLRELVPKLARLAIMVNVAAPGAVLETREIQAKARALGIEPVRVEIRQAEDIVPTIEALVGRVNALYVATDPLMFTNRISINALAQRVRMPTIYGNKEYADAGGLVSYGPNFPDLFRRAAEFVDKIMRGTKPADIPVEQPTKFELVVNLKTAKALGIEIPPTLLARADEVIE